MKFISLFAIALAVNYVRAAGEEVPILADARDGNCEAAGTRCPTIDCCGTATPVSGQTTKKVCQSKDESTWSDADQGNALYTFVCDEVTQGALSLAMSSTVMLASMSALYLY